jgi:small neutral amino acid transporter SnatA (MarC family)
LASFHQMSQAIVTVLAVINPVVCGSIFLTLTSKLPLAKRRLAAIKVALSILVILMTSAVLSETPSARTIKRVR